MQGREQFETAGIEVSVTKWWRTDTFIPPTEMLMDWKFFQIMLLMHEQFVIIFPVY